MNIAACSSIYKDFTLRQALSGISGAGYRFVEIAAMPGWCEHLDPYKPETIAALKKALEETGLKLAAISAHCDFLEAPQRKKLMDTIILSHDLGCPIVVTSPGAGGDDLRRERIRALSEIDACCANHGIKLALEPHGEMGGGELLYGLIKEADTKCVFINYDTANVVFFKGLDPIDDIKATEGYLCHVHYKDKRGPQGVWDFPPLGKGELNFGEITGYLKRAGYNGCISVEIEFTPEAKHTYDELNAAVKDSLLHLNNIFEGGQ